MSLSEQEVDIYLKVPGLRRETPFLSQMLLFRDLENVVDSFKWAHYILTLLVLFALFLKKWKPFGLFCTRSLCWLAVISCCPVVCQNNAVISLNEKVIANDYQNGDDFGYSVSISGNFAIVGARSDDDNGTSSGSAYIFERNVLDGSWNQIQKLLANDADAGDRFGWDVSISGNYAIVGAYGDDDDGSDSGSAYIFEINIANGTWIEKQKLTAHDAAADDRFGLSVDIDGNYGYAIVGAYGNDDDDETDSGSAYIFEKRDSGGQWIQVKQLTAFDAAEDDYFGIGVSISGDDAIVAALGDDNENGDNSGSAYIFQRNDTVGTWNFTNKIVASDGAADDYFGQSVSIFGDLVFVGAYGDDDDAGSFSGSAYIFERQSNGSWIEIQKLVAQDAAAGDEFGRAMSINKNYAIVGAHADDYDGGSDSGAAYIFERDQLSGYWNQTLKLVASDPASNDYFGRSVGISDENIVIIGAYGNESAFFDGPYATYAPTSNPTSFLSYISSSHPSDEPSGQPSHFPTMFPAYFDDLDATYAPTSKPSYSPSDKPTIPSFEPTQSFSRETSLFSTEVSSGSSDNAIPMLASSSQPSAQPSNHPSDQPSNGTKINEKSENVLFVLIVGLILILFVFVFGIYLCRRSWKRGNPIPRSKADSYRFSSIRVGHDKKTDVPEVKTMSVTSTSVSTGETPSMDVQNSINMNKMNDVNSIDGITGVAATRLEIESDRVSRISTYDDEGVNNSVDALGMEVNETKHDLPESTLISRFSSKENPNNEDEQTIEIENFKKTVGNETPVHKAQKTKRKE